MLALPKNLFLTTLFLSVTVCPIKVEQQNKQQHEYIFFLHFLQMLEDAVVGTTVDSFSANDRDAGLNGEYRFNISSGNNKGLFAINPQTGM
jgi:hypothetical protein